MQERTSPLRSSCRADRKIYVVRLIWSPSKLIMNCGRFSPRRLSRLPLFSAQKQRSGPVGRLLPVSRAGLIYKSVLDLFLTWETWRTYLGDVFYWDKINPSIYMRELWPIEFPTIQSSYKQINLLLLPLFSFPSTSILFIPWFTTKDDVLGLSANRRQPGNVLALTGSLPDESFGGFFASLPEN
jgi:hypothetical protein